MASLNLLSPRPCFPCNYNSKCSILKCQYFFCQNCSSIWKMIVKCFIFSVILCQGECDERYFSNLIQQTHLSLMQNDVTTCKRPNAQNLGNFRWCINCIVFFLANQVTCHVYGKLKVLEDLNKSITILGYNYKLCHVILF